jgi:glycosyltransferase involved in cell wall biosynthesis
MMSNTVSVIIPCFNVDTLVGDAIRSILSQSYRDVEIIVVDDGSTDRSVDVLKGFGNRIRWSTGLNRGACAARNIGLEMATGEFVQFFDADDLMHPTKIARCVDTLRDMAAPSLVYTLQKVVSLAPDDVPARQWNRRTGFEDPIAFMLQGDLPTPAPLHRRSTLLELGGFDERLSCAQDREFHLRLALAGVQFQLIPEVLFTIRRRSGSIGTTNELRIHEYRGELAISSFNHLTEKGQLNEQRRIACAAMCAHAARGLLLAQPEKARELNHKACQMHPTGGKHVVYSRRGRLLVRLLGARMAERLSLRLKTVCGKDGITK